MEVSKLDQGLKQNELITPFFGGFNPGPLLETFMEEIAWFIKKFVGSSTKLGTIGIKEFTTPLAFLITLEPEIETKTSL